MVLATDGLLDERLVHRLAVNYNRVIPLHRELGHLPRLVDANPKALLDLVGDALVDLRPAVAVAFKALRGRDADLVEHLKDDTAVPEDLLKRKVVDADGLPKIHESDW